jgi:hypothetical protein
MAWASVLEARIAAVPLPWPPMTIALLLALAGSLGLMVFIVKRLENS